MIDELMIDDDELTILKIENHLTHVALVKDKENIVKNLEKYYSINLPDVDNNRGCLAIVLIFMGIGFIVAFLEKPDGVGFLLIIVAIFILCLLYYIPAKIDDNNYEKKLKERNLAEAALHIDDFISLARNVRITSNVDEYRRLFKNLNLANEKLRSCLDEKQKIINRKNPFSIDMNLYDRLSADEASRLNKENREKHDQFENEKNIILEKFELEKEYPLKKEAKKYQKEFDDFCEAYSASLEYYLDAVLSEIFGRDSNLLLGFKFLIKKYI